MKKFVINQQLKPSGDQPKAIEALCQGLRRGCRSQVLLGVTGSGKTFTMANVIARENRPALILAPNKTLAAQLYGEMKAMFPENAVEYFVSYYDYYRPEAYVPSSDTFIEKDSAVNEQIEQLRLGATKSLLERNDVVVVASVSAIYGLGDPTMYKNSSLLFEVHKHYSMPDLMRDLAKLQYRRNRLGLARGDFYVTGEIIDIFPAEEDKTVIRLSFFGDMLESIVRIDPLTGEIKKELATYTLYPRTHYVTAEEETAKAIPAIKQEMQQVYQQFLEEGKFVEAQRIKQRTEMDLEMLKEVGFCYGIENYSRFFCNQQPGEPPPTLFEYFPSNGLLFIDESHVTLPQIKAMYRGDVARKSTLVTHGFRLPSALDNRPLKFEEFETLRPETIFVSATPATYELQQAQGAIVEQVVRPTGLLDPEIEVRPTKNQIIDLCTEILWRREKNERICVLTLTKRMAEDLTHYLIDQGIKTQYLHSGIDTIERVEILNNLRLGNIEVLVGINLLREGLDLPEVSLIAILDADKEGFLRSSPALIQMIGRAARHLSGRAILYADKITPSMQEAMDETRRRRLTQMAYNERHGRSPTAVTRSIRPSLQEEVQSRSAPAEGPQERYTQAEIIALQEKMRRHAELLEFEQALKIQQQLKAAQINYSASDNTSKTRRKTVLPAKSRRARSIQTPPDEKR